MSKSQKSNMMNQIFEYLNNIEKETRIYRNPSLNPNGCGLDKCKKRLDDFGGKILFFGKVYIPYFLSRSHVVDNCHESLKALTRALACVIGQPLVPQVLT
jgi:hypothetical protein